MNLIGFNYWDSKTGRKNMEVEIIYCMAWNYQPDADRVSAEIKEAISVEANLVASAGGVFNVMLDGKLIFSKHKFGRFPEEGEITKLLNISWIDYSIMWCFLSTGRMRALLTRAIASRAAINTMVEL